MSTSDQPTVAATVVLRRRAPLAPAARPMTSAELGQQFGADPADADAVRRALQDAGLTIDEEHVASRRFRVHGPADVIEAWERQPPEAVREAISAVLCGQGPQARPRWIVAREQAGSVSYTPLQLAQIYQFPDGDGSGQTIAIIELGGGFEQDDLNQYFSGLGVTTPNVKAVGVDGATNVPGKAPQGADGEVELDIEVAGAIAPAASILVYFAPNTDSGFLDAISTAAHADPAPTAMSISWGQSEDQWTAQARTAMDAAFADAVALGVTVTAAAGDNGSSDKDQSGDKKHTDFPASSPHVLGCGGTSLRATGTTVQSETVWDDGGQGGATGGGVSDVFPLPAWQKNVDVPGAAGGATGRGVPDVAAVADPQTGYQVRVDGSDMVVGGTSAVAPLWAGWVARTAQARGGALGLLQPQLYAKATAGASSPYLWDITTGNNGAFKARVGWDACTGLGVPEAQTIQAITSPGGLSPTS